MILATPTSEFSNSFVMTRKEITQLTQLTGKKVGVLTETGQTSVELVMNVMKGFVETIHLFKTRPDMVWSHYYQASHGAKPERRLRRPVIVAMVLVGVLLTGMALVLAPTVPH